MRPQFPFSRRLARGRSNGAAEEKGETGNNEGREQCDTSIINKGHKQRDLSTAYGISTIFP